MYNFREISPIKLADNQRIKNLTFKNMYNNTLHALFFIAYLQKKHIRYIKYLIAYDNRKTINITGIPLSIHVC